MMTPPLTQPQQFSEFDYSALDSTTRAVVEQKTSELKKLIRRSAQDIADIGQNLIDVKEHMGHGKFRNWLKAEFDWSVATANRFMQVARQFKCLNLMHLDIATNALYLLARPSTPEQVRQEALERAAQGETITSAVAEEILFYHTIDVEAEVLDEKEFSAPDPASPGSEPAPTTNYEVGDRITILRRQHVSTEDKWVGKSARIWEVTADNQLRVNVEGHKGVRFTLDPDWVKPVTESPEKYQPHPEPELLDPAGEPDPESSINIPSEEENEAVPRFEAGDRLQGTNLGQHNQKWAGEVAEVLEVTDTTIKVVLQIPRFPQSQNQIR